MVGVWEYVFEMWVLTFNLKSQEIKDKTKYLSFFDKK